MTDENQEPNELTPSEPTENQPPVIVPISHKPLKTRYRRFADRYLVNGMNATEAYRHVFKPKVDETAHANAYKIMALQGVREYVEKRLQELNEASYHPEAIKSALAERAVSSKRDSDKIRSLEIMAKIQGLLTEGQATQVNFFDTDVMTLARKRLSERKKDSQKPVVIDADSPQVIERQEVTDSMSYNNNYVPAESESVLSTNEDSSVGKVDAKDSSADGDGQEKDRPLGGGAQEPPPHPQD